MKKAMLAVCAMLAACGSREPAAPTASPAPASAGPSVPSVARAWTLAAPPEPWVIVARDAISVAAGAPLVRLVDARVAESDRETGTSYLIVPLRDHLQRAPASPQPVGVAIDPEVPYRTVAEVVYTLGSSGRTELAFVVRRDGAVSALPLSMPSVRPQQSAERADALADVLAGGAATETPGAAPLEPANAPPPLVEPAAQVAVLDEDPGLSLNILVTAAGARLSGTGGRLAPGCEELTGRATVTVPARNAAQDLAELTRCLERVHREFPSEDRAIVSADADVPFRDVASVIAASRGTPERPLFPQTVLAVALR